MRITALLLCAIGLVFPPSSLSAQDSPTVLMQQKHWKRVRAIAQSKLKASADDAEANYMMSQVLLAWDDLGAALPYAEKGGQALASKHRLSLGPGSDSRRASRARECLPPNRTCQTFSQ